MFGVILKATNRSFQKGMAFCRSIYVKKVMKLLAFIFEQPSYMYMRGSRKFCQRGSNLENFFFFDEGREDLSTIISGPSLARQRNAIKWRFAGVPIMTQH